MSRDAKRLAADLDYLIAAIYPLRSLEVLHLPEADMVKVREVEALLVSHRDAVRANLLTAQKAQQ